MAKRMIAMVLAMMLLGCLPGQAAVLTKAEQYAAALDGLKAYLNDDETMPIADLNESFNELGGYGHSIMLEMYTKVLLLIEAGEFTPVQRLIGYMKDDGTFVVFVEENEEFGSLDALEWYARGRQAEAEGRRVDAADCYRMCPSFLDSASRRRKLDDGRLEELYQLGIVNFLKNTYDGYAQACSFFQAVEDDGGYEDSKAYLQKSLMYRDLFMPTPEPTIQPTSTPIPTATPAPTAAPTPVSVPPFSNAPYDMGIPYLNGAVYRENSMNVYVYWVQVQMKQTGLYYQGSKWDETGNLGDHTMDEIRKFMRSQGYSGHSGCVDQTVIDALASYLGSGRAPVYMGGYYDKMNSILNDPQTQDMDAVVSNLRDGVPRVTKGARWMQVCLKELGYYNSTIDGKFGEGTLRALNRFQKDYGFEERDYLSLGVARALIKACADRGCGLYDLP